MTDQAEEAFSVLAGWPKCYRCHQTVSLSWLPTRKSPPGVHPTCYLVVVFLSLDESGRHRYNPTERFVDDAMAAINNADEKGG